MTIIIVSRYCPICKRTKKTELTMDGDHIVKVRCLTCGRTE